MDKRHDDAGFSRRQDSRTLHPFARLQGFQAAAVPPSLKSSLELGGPLHPFPNSLVASLHWATRQEDHHHHHQGVGGRENNNSQERELETNSSLTPLDLYCHSTSLTSQAGSGSTSGITPCWSSLLLSDFKVPSLNDSRETLKADSTARSVPGRGGLHEEDVDRHRARLRLGDDEGEQRVPVHVDDRSDAAASASLPRGQNLLPTQSSQFSNSWPVEQGKTLTPGGEGSLVGSDQGSFTGSRRWPTLTSTGQGTEAAANVSSSFCLPSVYSSNPVYAPIPSYAFPRVVEALKGKSKVENMSRARSGTGVGGNVPRMPVGMCSESRKEGVEPPGLNTMDPERGACNDPGANHLDGKQATTEDAQPMDTDEVLGLEPRDKVDRQTSEAEKSVQKQGRLRNSSEAADEFRAGPSGFTKRSRQHRADNSSKVQGEDDGGKPQTEHCQAKGGKTEPSGLETCNWLQRWLPANSTLRETTAAGPKDSRLSNGAMSSFPLDGRGKVGHSGRGSTQESKSRTENMREEHGRERDRCASRWTELPSKGDPFTLSPFSSSAPSASAIAMVGAASRCLGPQFNQQKASSIMMKPSDKKMLPVKHVQFAEPQRSS